MYGDNIIVNGKDRKRNRKRKEKEDLAIE